MRRIIIDAQSCAGCRRCELVCSFTKTSAYSPSASRITVLKDDAIGMDYPIVCHQCDICSVDAACPAEAFSKASGGVATVDKGTCISCGACVQACKYGAVKMHKGLPIVCDLCGGDPICVAKCPTHALRLEEVDGEPLTPEEEHRALMRKWGVLA